MAKAIAIVSGGLDSVTLAYYLKTQAYSSHLISFDYGQRHKKEIGFAKLCAIRLCARHSKIDLHTVGRLLKGSALTDSIAVPDGHYAAPNMAITIVPNRNMMMLSIAYAVAVSEQADCIAFGAHAGDHFIYPDCRTDFITAFERTAQLANDSQIKVLAPFVTKTKTDIVTLAAGLGVPFAETWSCYKGLEKHCGTCGTCVERKEAFEQAGLCDPTEYLNSSVTETTR